jgi:hypothetical protein
MVRFLHSPIIATPFLVAFEVLESFKERKIERTNRFVYQYRCLIIFNAVSSVFFRVLIWHQSSMPGIYYSLSIFRRFERISWHFTLNK